MGRGKAVKIPLINSSGISGVNPATLNVRETFTIDRVRGQRRSCISGSTKVSNAAGGATEFDKPVDNIGDKVFGGPTGYAAYANQHRLRLNTSTPVTVPAAQSPLGVAGGDNAGYPNGRRSGDDVVDMSLRVAMGTLCVLTGPTDTLKVGCKPTDAPAGGLALNYRVRKTAANDGVTFPYFTTPLPGNSNPPAAAGTTYP